MRILMVEFFDRGGLLHYGWQMARALARASAGEGDGVDNEVVLLTGRHPEAGVGEPGGTGPRVRLLPRLWSWNPHRRPRWLPRRLVRAARGVRYGVVWWQVLRLARQLSPEVILLSDLEHRCDAWFVRRLRKMQSQAGHRLADIWHNVEAFERNRPGRLVRDLEWRRRMALDFDAVFVHGTALAEQMRLPPGRAAVAIAHGNQQWIEQQAGPDPDLDRRFSLLPGQVVALLFGALTPYKGIEDLLDALAMVAPRRRPVVVIAGLATAAVRPAAWRRQALRQGLEPWLRWDERYVPTAEIAWYFRRADLVLLPYRAASQSGVAHLGLTFGKPLIVTSTGSLAELIDGNGRVVAPANPPALAQSIEELGNSRRLRQQMGRRSAELAVTRHNWDRIAVQVLEALHADPSPSQRPGFATSAKL